MWPHRAGALRVRGHPPRGRPPPSRSASSRAPTVRPESFNAASKVFAGRARIADGMFDVTQHVLGPRDHHHVAGLVGERESTRQRAAYVPEFSLRESHRCRSEQRSRFDNRRQGGPVQDLVIPADALRRMPPDAPEEEQAPRDVGCFGRAIAIEEPSQCAAVALEIVTHAIQPCPLLRADQSLCRQGRFHGAIAHQPLHGVIALACRGEFQRCVCPHGFEHL